MKIALATIAAIAAFVGARPANSEIFFCGVDSNGNLVIQDTPCAGARRPQATQGNAQAQFNHGAAMYEKGQTIEAVKWWRLAAAQGNAAAQSNLSAMNEKGRGDVGIDLLAAREVVPDPLAPVGRVPIDLYTQSTNGDDTTQPGTVLHRGSYLDRAFNGAVMGALIGAILGFFILVRALVKKFKVPAAAGAMAIYRDHPQAVKTGAALLLGCAAFLVYFLFFRTNTVDDYLNNYQERIEKLQECSHLPDVSKDRECMNAVTAQRMFMLR